MNIRHLRDHVIRPALLHLAAELPGFARDGAVELLLGTIAQESNFRHLVQLGGPARGLYQVEPATYRDIQENYLRYKPAAQKAVLSLRAAWPDSESQLVTNLAFATAIARLVYYRSPAAIPATGDIAGHARVWKRVYNTPLGKGTEAEFIANFNRFVAPNL